MKAKQSKCELKLINYIASVIENSEISNNQMPTDEEFLSMCSDIICQFDTDVAIEVMNKLAERYGDVAKNQALSIKVNYGY
jgi:hypothetical protein